jgi:apolipoprotein N-acyltransferase
MATGLMREIAARLSALTGWRKRGVAFAAGALSVLALAPFFFAPVLWLTLPTLVWLIDGATTGTEPRRWYARSALLAAEIGWWWAFGYFLAGLFWIGEAFLVEAEHFAVFMPFAVLLMPAGLALFYSAASALAVLFWLTGTWRVLALALSLSAMEWVRGHVLSGFPWNVLGYALTYPLAFMQSASVFGLYGLTFAAVLIFALPLTVSAVQRSRSRRAMAFAIAGLPLIAMGVLGQLRLATASAETVPGVKFRIVQPSIPQREKWIAGNQERIFNEHVVLSLRDGAGALDNLANITHVIWSEAAMPFMPLDTPPALAAIGKMLPEGTFLIAGALRAERAPPQSPRLRNFFNSLLVFGKGGLLVTLYDKIDLVPFGEFLPLRWLLEAVGLRQLAHTMGSFESGSTPRPLLQVPGLPPVVPLICYEAIFPGAIVQGSARPGVIINATNDGWFGNTTGPRQHLHQARVRAVEEGLPLIRAANNGISAAFDGYGRVLGRIELDHKGVLDVSLPVALQMPLYARFGDSLFFTVWLLGAGILGWVVWRPPHT